MKQTPLQFGKSKAQPKREYKPFVPGPNPELPGFIKRHATPYDPETDKYDVPAFDKDIVVDKAAPPKAIYDMHTYWSKKHWAAIREYIRHYLPKKYYPEGTGLVLDCFSGSGMTGVAAMMEGRPCVLIDASPAAAFISHCYTHPVDPDELQTAYDRMMNEPYPADLRKKLKAITGEEIENLQQELDWLYATKCDRCGGDATTEYVVYSERFQCPRCGEIVALFDCPETKVPYQVGSKSKQKTELKKRRVCPACLKKYGEPHKDFVISTRSKRFGSIMVLVSYECLGKCKPKRDRRRHDENKGSRKRQFFEKYDIGKLKSVEDAKIPHWYPNRNMMDVEDNLKPWGTEWRPGRNFRTVAELYTKRNLWALAAIKNTITRMDFSQDALLLAQSAALFGVSRMVRESNTATVAGTYYLPQLSKEVKVPYSFNSKINMVIEGYKSLSKFNRMDCTVSQDLILRQNLGRDALDFIFTDPPYVGKVQYGELNFIWESWLGYSGSWLKDEITVNQYRQKTIEHWDSDMREALAKCFIALKPGRWLSLCYHDTEPDTWTRVQNILLDTGFEIHSVNVLDPKQKSQNQLNAEKVVKGDLVLNCLKPWEQKTVLAQSDTLRITSRVRDILVETISNRGGQTRDDLWNFVLKRLLTRGLMAEHRFDDTLQEVAVKSESGRWFLKEEFESLSESDLKNEEVAGSALEKFASLRCMGVPVAIASELALQVGLSRESDEGAIEKQIRQSAIKGMDTKGFRLGGRLINRPIIVLT